MGFSPFLSLLSVIMQKYLHGEKHEQASVFVPLCGKTLDLVWLCDQGMDVIGCDLSALAAQQFFNESNIPFSTSMCIWSVYYMTCILYVYMFQTMADLIWASNVQMIWKICMYVGWI